MFHFFLFACKNYKKLWTNIIAYLAKSLHHHHHKHHRCHVFPCVFIVTKNLLLCDTRLHLLLQKNYMSLFLLLWKVIPTILCKNDAQFFLLLWSVVDIIVACKNPTWLLLLLQNLVVITFKDENFLYCGACKNITRFLFSCEASLPLLSCVKTSKSKVGIMSSKLHRTSGIVKLPSYLVDFYMLVNIIISW